LIAGCGIALAVLFVILGVVRILPWEAAGTLAATAIGAVSKIIELERQETRKKEAVPPEQSRLESEEGLLWEESILVSKNSCSHYDLRIGADEKITGEISSDNYFNVYFLTPRNFTKYTDGEEDFKYEYGTEHASRLKVNFTPGKAGRFYCII